MTYVDPSGSAPGQLHGVVFSCHMFADTVDELVAFAARIGLRREWLQGLGEKGRVPHFDLTEGKRWQAIRVGAVEVTREQAVAIWKCHKEGVGT